MHSNLSTNPFPCRVSVAAIALLGVLTACANSTSSGRPSGLSLSFMVPASHGTVSITPSTGGSAGAAFDVSATQSLTLTQVQLVVERAELGAHAATDCGDDEDECQGGCDDHNAACEEFTAGPILVDLPVNGDLLSPVAAVLPAGTFDELELKVGPPNHGDADASFLAAHASWPPNTSVHVVGTFDAGDGHGPVPFDVTFAARGRFELDFQPPLVIDSNHSAGNVTLTIDVVAWFAAPTGGFLNPLLVSTNEGIRMQVVRNIKRSLRAFRDDDRNGHDDHD